MKRTLLVILLVSLFIVSLPVALFAQNATPVATIAPQNAIVLKAANLRAGPGTNFTKVGAATAKQAVILVGKNAQGTWYQLQDGKWIAASLVQVMASSTTKPVATAVPGTPTPAAPAVGSLPYTFTGKGDAVVDVSAYLGKRLLLLIEGNAAQQYFGVMAYGENDNMVDLLVNTTEAYTGLRPLNLANVPALLLEVKAVGNWKITLQNIATARRVEKGVAFVGAGDDVLLLDGSALRSADITGNSAAQYLGMMGYGNAGLTQLFVNTTDPYAGTVRIQRTTTLLVVQATGEWTILAK